MIETIDKTIIPTGKIYKDKAFWVGIFIGGPLVAGYLFSENFKSLGQPEKVKSTWVITIAVTIALFGAIFLIPENINIPNQIIPIAYTAIAVGLFKKYQEEKATAHIEKGGLVYGWWRVIGVGVIGLLITLVSLFVIVYTSDTLQQATITTKTYGAVRHEIDFDQSNISEQEIDKIAEGFTETGFFDRSFAKYIYVEKDENKFVIYISVVRGVENNPEAIQPFVEIRNEMDEYLSNNEVAFKLVVDYIDNVIKVIE
ncbi:hypothetical protein [Aquimarina aquimarini]|uniref:hypothetical protein n=1 Tax=Aquimarina aquimarini TaxID=1191734 RepID=UPI001F36C038|nr:hypothetical protein [Aquimarina aquimarini]